MWAVELRGTYYSRDHERLDFERDAKKYWDFTVEEMGMLDVPAVVRFIKKATGMSKVNCLGFSMGTTVLLGGASVIPDFYEENVEQLVLYAP